MKSPMRWRLVRQGTDPAVGAWAILEDTENTIGGRIHILVAAIPFTAEKAGVRVQLIMFLQDQITPDPRYPKRECRAWERTDTAPAQQDMDTGKVYFPWAICKEVTS